MIWIMGVNMCDPLWYLSFTPKIKAEVHPLSFHHVVVMNLLQVVKTNWNRYLAKVLKRCHCIIV